MMVNACDISSTVLSFSMATNAIPAPLSWASCSSVRVPGP